jgi:hypothetical protein
VYSPRRLQTKIPACRYLDDDASDESARCGKGESMIQCPVVAQGYRASSSAEMLSIRNTAIAPRLRRSLLESWWRAGRSRGSAGGPTCAPARCGTGIVGCPVAAAGQSVAGDFARGCRDTRGCRDRSHSAQRGQRGLAAEPVRVGASGDQQFGGGVRTDTVGGAERGLICETRTSSCAVRSCFDARGIRCAEPAPCRPSTPRRWWGRCGWRAGIAPML